MTLLRSPQRKTMTTSSPQQTVLQLENVETIAPTFPREVAKEIEQIVALMLLRLVDEHAENQEGAHDNSR
jgi:hypothetical protein